MQTKLTMVLLLWSFTATSQVVTHDFDDGMGIDQTWYGDTASFRVMNGSLWSDHQVSNAAFSVYTGLPQVEVFEWLFVNHLHFNTSSANYADFGLFTDTGFSNGLVVRIGGTPDHVSVYIVEQDQYRQVHYGEEKITVDRRIQVALTGTDSLLTGHFQADGYNETFALAGTGIKPRELQWFRLEIYQSTSGFFGKHELDYVRYGEPVYDTTAPAVSQLVVVSGSALRLEFSEALQADELPVVNLESPNGWGSIEEVTLIDENHLLLSPDLHNGKMHRLRIERACDLSGNCSDTVIDFIPLFHENPLFGEVVVSEIMAQPLEGIGLPPFEYMELCNRSGKVIDLSYLTLSSNGRSVSLPEYFLLPDSFVAITGSADWPLADYPNVLTVNNMFAIHNSLADIQLRDQQGELIHEVQYTSGYFTDKARAQGGWSVEMGDIDRYCTMVGNWKPSVSALGGTPGRPNSWRISIGDEEEPKLRSTGLSDDAMVSFHFNESLHSASEIRLIDPKRGTEVTDWAFQFNSVTATLHEIPATEPLPYLLSGTADCYGNTSTGYDTVYLGRPEQTLAGELIINEILFDEGESAEYVELRNVSNHVIDLHRLNLRTGPTGSDWSVAWPFVGSSHILLPGQLICFTTDPDRVIAHFNAEGYSDHIFYMEALPALNNMESRLAVVDRSLNWIDTVHYAESMHYPLLADVEDVSLERLKDVDPPWMSASSASGHGTPGSPNSNHYGNHPAGKMKTGTINISCDPVTPNNDGWNDLVTIEFGHPGMFSYSMAVYRMDGYPVASLVEHGYGMDGAGYTWNGSGQEGRMLEEGIYLILAEIRTEDDQTVRMTKCITLHY